MKTGNYTTTWTALDVAPANAAKASTYCTKLTKKENEKCTDTKVAATSGNGFMMTLIGTATNTGNTSGITAKRVGNGQYTYTLYKLYDDPAQPYCKAGSGNKDDEELCADYKGVDDYKAPTATEPSAGGSQSAG